MEIKSIGSDRKRFVIWRHYDLLEAADVLSENHLLENNQHLRELSKVTRVLSNGGREGLFSALSNISSVGVLVFPNYIFVLCRLAHEYVIIDTRVIRSQLGGNRNGIVVAFPNIKICLSWIIQRFNLSGVKGSDLQKLYELFFPAKKNAFIFGEEDLSNDGNSSSICSDFRNISQNKERRHFDDSAKNKNRIRKRSKKKRQKR